MQSVCARLGVNDSESVPGRITNLTTDETTTTTVHNRQNNETLKWDVVHSDIVWEDSARAGRAGLCEGTCRQFGAT
jgi:hypothetical protein